MLLEKRNNWFFSRRKIIWPSDCRTYILICLEHIYFWRRRKNRKLRYFFSTQHRSLSEREKIQQPNFVSCNQYVCFKVSHANKKTTIWWWCPPALITHMLPLVTYPEIKVLFEFFPLILLLCLWKVCILKKTTNNSFNKRYPCNL